PLIWASGDLQAAGTAGRPLRILDACAAPGGKTGHLLELAVARSRAAGQPMTTRVTALEISPKRAARIHETLDRLALSVHADVQVADGKLPQKWWDGQPWDAVLLDAPCTASGIVRRHPDVPWLRRPADIDQLVAEQRALLEMAWSQLAVGGRLVYCTCSTFKEEGEWQIDAFLEQHPDAQRVEAPGHVLPGRVNATPDANLNNAALVHAAFDGFFYAAFDKHAT
ncbi:MAG: 16S rRNA (cytosine(967)-C(5))-methyltransferase RsmB, partial [Burkholderiaceae bacterium]